MSFGKPAFQTPLGSPLFFSTGVALALYASDPLYSFELQWAADVSGAPGTWYPLASNVDGSTEIYADREPDDGSIHWYRLRHTGFGDTPSAWTTAISAKIATIPRTLTRPPLPPLTLRSFRETARTPATITAAWQLDPRQDAVDVWLTTVVGNITTSPWPERNPATLLYPPPTLVLSDTATTVAIPVPTVGVTYAQVQPRNSSSRPGKYQRLTIVAVTDRPLIYALLQQTAVTNLFASVSFSIADAQNLGGTLTAWVNRSSSNNADPTATPDGTLAIASTVFNATPSTLFGALTLFSNIPVHPGRGKAICLEFVNTNGVSSGVQTFTLTSQGGIIDQNGHLIAGAITDTLAFAVGIRPPIVAAALPADNTLSDFVLLTTDHKLYRWNNTAAAWKKDVDGADIIAASIVAGSISAGAIGATAIAAGAVQATHIAVAVLDQISTNIGIIVAGKLTSVSGAVTIDLNATGTSPVISAPSFSILANGTATFGGTVTSTSFLGSFASFRANVTVNALQVVGSGLDLGWNAGAGVFGSLALRGQTTAAHGDGLNTGGAAYVTDLQASGQADVGSLKIAANLASFGAANSGGAGFRLVLVPN
jgi:hypothetical protein